MCLPVSRIKKEEFPSCALSTWTTPKRIDFVAHRRLYLECDTLPGTSAIPSALWDCPLPWLTLWTLQNGLVFLQHRSTISTHPCGPFQWMSVFIAPLSCSPSTNSVHPTCTTLHAKKIALGNYPSRGYVLHTHRYTFKATQDSSTVLE